MQILGGSQKALGGTEDSFPDAKLAEDGVEQVFGGGFALKNCRG
jgi:hypothetical protein